jgi:hypothetical protein
LSLEEISEKVKIADEATKGLAPEIRKAGFELILKSLLEKQNDQREPQSPRAPEEKVKKVKKTKNISTPANIAPIPVDLKAKDTRPSLKELYAQKTPTSQQETLTVFVYYLNHHLGIQDIQFGQIVSCYNEVGARKPEQLVQLVRDTKNHKAWVDIGSVPNTARITIAGENLVEHDLPREKK